MDVFDELATSSVIQPSTNVRYDRKSGDLPLYPGALITAKQSRCLVMEMANRHRLSGAATDDILKLISLHCPVPSHCCPSLYLLQKEFELPSSELKLCYYCPSCFVPLEESGDAAQISFAISSPLILKVTTFLLFYQSKVN